MQTCTSVFQPMNDEPTYTLNRAQLIRQLPTIITAYTSYREAMAECYAPTHTSITAICL